MGAAAEERLWLGALAEILERSHLFQPDQLAGVVDTAMSRLGIGMTIFLVDVEQRTLRALPQPGQGPHEPQPVDTSLPGRVFRLGVALPAAGGHGWWIPMVNGTDRLGVIEFRMIGGVDPDDEVLVQRCKVVAGLVGHLITVTKPKGDHLYLARRSEPMSTGAELLSHMLPPLTSSCERMGLTAILEPCYDVGGDGFDYAIDGSVARMYIFDAVGRGLSAATACVVAMAAIRASRRAGEGMYAQARAADAKLAEQFGDQTFVTAVLAELDLDTGRFRYINAGHPWPLVLRGGRMVRELDGGRRLPLGLDDPGVKVAEEMLEPGDRLLLYSDGVVEARSGDGDPFGVNRLIDHAQRHAADGLPAPETLRRLAHAVTAHNEGAVTDDATLLLAEWSPIAAARTVP